MQIYQTNLNNLQLFLCRMARFQSPMQNEISLLMSTTKMMFLFKYLSLSANFIMQDTLFSPSDFALRVNFSKKQTSNFNGYGAREDLKKVLKKYVGKMIKKQLFLLLTNVVPHVIIFIFQGLLNMQILAIQLNQLKTRKWLTI